MNIANMQFDYTRMSLDIFVTGCTPPYCKGCHNPELWDFEVGYPYETFIKNVKNRISSFSRVIDRVSIMGGEPLDQNLRDLDDFVDQLIEAKDDDVELWLFTKYSLQKLKGEMPMLLEKFDFVKCGRYDINKTDDCVRQYGVLLASNNQKIFKKGVDYCVQKG